jgi:hypothetical protein
MALAMIYPEPEKGGRGKQRQNGTETLQFSKQRLSQARAVLRYSPASFDHALDQLLDGLSDDQRPVLELADVAKPHQRAEHPLVDPDRDADDPAFLSRPAGLGIFRPTRPLPLLGG